MKRPMIIASSVVVMTLLVWAFAQVISNAPRDLAALIPPGPLLYLEAKDFGSLLRDWNSSDEKKLWLASDNYEVFSRSRLFLKLQQAQGEFAAAAGVPPNMDLVENVAGGQSAIALYDIGNLEFLYITRMAADQFAMTALWKTRGSYQPRQSASLDYYVKSDPTSRRVAAFAAAKDYVLLATREDVLAAALALIAGQNNAAMKQEPWFDRSVKSVQAPGELRLVLNLDRLGRSPHFRSYWVQQNLADLRQYGAGISDLSRTSGEIRENRVLLRTTEESASWNEGAVAEILKLVPADAGFYQAWASPSAEQAFERIRAKILDPRPAGQVPRMTAPEVALGNGVTGNESDLETRIDEPPIATNSQPEFDQVRRLLQGARLEALMCVQTSRVQSDGVFVGIDSAVVLMGATDWPRTALDQPGAWSYSGRFLVLATSKDFLDSILKGVSNPPAGQGARYAAAYRHSKELPNFIRMTRLIDNPFTTGGLGNGEPAFFSRNIAGLGQALSRVDSESIMVHDTGVLVRQSVVYQLKK